MMNANSSLTRINHIIYSPAGERLIVWLILLNSVLLGLETSSTVMALAGGLINCLNSICLWLFVLEMVLKIASAPRVFFRSGWDIFDLTVIAMSVFPFQGHLSVLRALRLARILRLISRVPRLRIVVESIIKSLPSLAWVSVLLIVIFYIFAVLSTTIFGREFPDWFGSIPASLYTLFQVLTLESWSMGIARPVIAEFPHAYLFFIPFIFLSSFIILNLFIAIIVNYLSQVSSQVEKAGPRRLTRRRRLWRG
jgi:voltage-gated sodium channel